MARTKPFEGLKVFDMGWAMAGPLAATYLATLGAEVVKIDGRLRPDIQRVTGPYKDGIVDPNRACLMFITNSNKLSLALNLKHPLGLDVAQRLVRWADVVLENFSPGVIGRMGLGYEEIRKIKPDIIMISSSNQGQSGPHTGYRGFGPHVAASAGLWHVTGYPDGEPAQPEVSYPDFIGGVFGIIAILAALLHHRRTGKGQYIDLSQAEGSVHFAATAMLDYGINGVEQNRRANRSLEAAPHGVFPCEGMDRWCAIAVETEEQWRSLCRVMGNPDLASDARFATLEKRQANEDELEVLIAEWTRARPPQTVMEMLQHAGIPAGVVQNPPDLLEHDPQLRHRHYYWDLDVLDVGRCIHPSFPVRFAKYSPELRPAPIIGQHNEYICSQILGLSDEELATLIEEGVIE